MARERHDKDPPDSPARTEGTTAQARARVWLVWHGRACLGQGRVALLQQIEAQGSIALAARSLGLSYRAAWKWVKRLNEFGDEPMVMTTAGGSHGGGARLTPTGRAAVSAYRIVEKHARAAMDRANAEISELLASESNTPVRPP